MCFGGVLKIFGVAWRRLEPSCGFASDLKASWRRLEGILEASWRCFGGGLGRLGSALLGLGRDIGFIVDFLPIFSSLND